jgi:hypothetical protein
MEKIVEKSKRLKLLGQALHACVFRINRSHLEISHERRTEMIAQFQSLATLQLFQDPPRLAS